MATALATRAHATNRRRILYLDFARSVSLDRGWPRGERRGTIRHLTGQTRQLDAIQMRTRRKEGEVPRNSGRPISLSDILLY